MYTNIEYTHRIMYAEVWLLFNWPIFPISS